MAILRPINDEHSLENRLAKLEAENAALKQAANRKLTIKVGPSGGVSVYGLQRWPTTLYKSQWEKLIANIDEVTAFIKENEDKLAVKAPK